MMLAPYRVLDLCDERGQLAGQVLAQLGADVIAIEAPGGSRSRSMRPFAHGEEGVENSLWHRALNRGKRSVVLDVLTGPGIAALKQLIADADVLIDTDPSMLDALGLDDSGLAALNPQLVRATITAFGRTGPKAHWHATDLTAWAAGGPLILTGDDDRPPVPVGVPQAFAHASAEAAGGVVLALLERAASGLGQCVDVSAQETAAPATQSGICAVQNSATPVTRTAGGVKAGPIHMRFLFPASDGYVSITLLFGAGMGPFTARFVQWMFDEGYCGADMLEKNWIEFGAMLADGREPISEYERLKELAATFTATKSKAQLFDAALSKGFLLAPIADLGDVLANEQLAFRDYWDRERGHRVAGPFAHCSATPLRRLGDAPALGAHTAEVLSESARPPVRQSGQSCAPRALPLDGLKVLDLAWVVAGPSTTRTLADFGATVIRIESNKRIETARTVQPFIGDNTSVERSVLFGTVNAGKRSVALDLGTAEGLAVVRDLARWADVVVESFSPKAMKAWGIDYESLRSVNPGVIMLSSTLFGQAGPLSRLAGLGTMASAMGGFFDITGWADRAPSGAYGAYTDYISHRFSTALVLAAIDHRRRTGEGQYLDFSQAEAAIHALGPAVLEREVNGRMWPRRGAIDDNHRPHVVVPTSDDRYVALACRTDRHRKALSGVVGSLDDAAVESWCVARSADDAMRTLQAAGVPAHTVQNSAECAADPHLAARGYFQTFPHSEADSITIEGPRIHLSATPGRVLWAGPSLGQHTHEVLTETLGYDDDRFAELLVAGALE